jgi:hypothetical protein
MKTESESRKHEQEKSRKWFLSCFRVSCIRDSLTSSRHPSLTLPALILTFASILIATSSAQARADHDLKKPYYLHVILHVADNRALTPFFQDELQRSVGDHLRQTFGDLAKVDVVITAKLPPGFDQGLEQAFDGLDQISDRQLHFVLLDYAAGQYRLQARGYDGTTGQPSTLVRRAQTGDRTAVGQLAARLVEENFAPVGTVSAAGKGVRLTLQGGGLGVRLDRWVKPGDVFAVSRIESSGSGLRGTRIPWALLEVVDAPHDGVCQCRYHRRFQEDELHKSPGVVAFRAAKIATTQAVVHLRLIDDERFEPIDGTPVHVSRPGTKEKMELTTNRDGLAITREPFANMVIVHLPREGATLPIEVIEGRTVLCRVKLKGGSDALVALDYRRDAWLRRLYDNVRLASERGKELGQKLSQSLTAAEEMAREGLKNLDAELAFLTEEHNELKKLAEQHKLAAARFDLKEGGQRLDELRGKRAKLEEFVQGIDKAIKEGEENKLFNQMLGQAKLLEAQADFAAAIAMYEKVVKARPNQPALQEQLDKLKQGWAIRGGKDHEEARRFAYEVWPKLDVAGLKKQISAARGHFATLKANDDRLTAQKLLLSDAVHVANLKKELDRLKNRESEDARNQAKVIGQVTAELRQLHEEVTAFVGR